MELPKDIKDEIWEYCRVNDISGVDNFITKMVKQGFTSEKFGSTPWEKEPEIKEVEKIVEKVIEKEIIKEVIKEVIKEIPVEKKIYVTDDKQTQELSDKLDGKDIEINDLYRDLEVRKNEVSGLNLKIGRLEVSIKKLDDNLDGIKTELDEARLELEVEKKKPKEKDNDIYGESKKGFFGSNVSDLWKKK